jgi:predicted Na+-dependent transporter
MFGMGSQMSFADFTGIIKMPKGVIVGVVSHYIIMPLVGFSIAKIFNLLTFGFQQSEPVLDSICPSKTSYKLNFPPRRVKAAKLR